VLYAADTSVAVPFMLDGHEFHEIARGAVDQHRPTLAGHARFEAYSQLTGGRAARLSPPAALTALAKNFGEPEWLTVEGSARVYALLAHGAIIGGAIYDALVAQAARDHDRTLLTLDRRAARTYQRVGVDYELLR
jgi:predicted nucleic acid-binding protein